ncbi:MAG: transporter substrate-binding domain-containing protein [Atopobiaceae bacterium]|nr:transporter substrate-binding domain-containing protein [Atopobiaceae bacterium]
MDEVRQRLYSRHQFIRLAGLAGAALLATGCGKSAPSSEDTPADVRAYDETYQAFDHARSVSEIQESGVLRIGVCSDTQPLSHLNIGGNYTGFEVAIANKLRWDIGSGIRYVETDPVDVAAYLASNKVDAVICSQMLPTDDVWQAFPFFAPRQAIVTKAGAEVATLDELEGSVVSVCEGTYAQRYIERQLMTADVHAYESHTTAYQALMNGTARALCVDQVVARCWTMNNPGYAVAIDDLGDPCPSGIMVAAQNEDLLKFMNHETYTLVNDNFVRRMYEKHIVPQVAGADYAQVLLPVTQDV